MGGVGGGGVGVGIISSIGLIVIKAKNQV